MIAPSAALAAVSAAILVYEVALLRIFGTLVAYHYAGLAASLAVLGIGLGALPAAWGASRRFSPGAAAGALALLLLAAPAAIRAASDSTAAALYGVAALPPFVAGGFYAASVLRDAGPLRGRLLAFDLFGAAAGAAAAVPLLDAGGPPAAVSAAAALAALGAALSAPASLPRALLWPVVAAAAWAGVQAFGWEGTMTALPAPGALRATKNLYARLADAPGARILWSRWSAYARTDVAELDDRRFRHIFTDGEAATLIPRLTAPPSPESPDIALLDARRRIGFLPFQLLSPARVYVVGVGGGLDAAFALFSGARQVVGVEVNPQAIEAARGAADFNAGLFSDRRLETHVDEARSHLERETRAFDMVYLSLTLTNVSAVPGYALVENYVHTTQACRLYLDRLAAGGFAAHVMHGRYDLDRALSTWIAALSRDGDHRSALDHVLVAGQRSNLPGDPERWFKPLLLVSRDRMDARTRRGLSAKVRELGYAVLFAADVERGPYAALEEGGPRAYDLSVAHNVRPAEDDRPFPNQFTKSVPPEAVRTMRWTAIAFAAVCAVAARASGLGAGGAVRWLLAGVLGFSFLAAESALIVRFLLPLGGPTRTFSVILFTVLLSAGAGAAAVAAFGIRLSRACLAAGAALAALWLLWPAAVETILDLPRTWRTVTSALLLAPIGTCMGMPFAALLRGLPAPAVPWAWAVNGSGAVAGGAAAMVLEMAWGVSATVALAAGTYVCCAILSRRVT